MSTEKHILAARRGNIRFRIIAICDTSRAAGVDESLMMTVLNDLKFKVTIAELRKEASYLASKKYIQHSSHRDVYFYKITALGVELLEGDIGCPSSITHPDDYY